MKSLVIVETASLDHQASSIVADATLRVITAARQRGLPVELLAFSRELAQAASAIEGVQRVLLAEMALPNAETLARQLASIAKDYSLIAASHSANTRAALPRTAAVLANSGIDACFLADVTGIVGTKLYQRGLYAGSVVAEVENTGMLALATFRSSSFEPATIGQHAADIVVIDVVSPFTASTLIERQANTQTGRDLSTANMVVSGGRGLASKDNMDRLSALAGQLGAALGASRAAVDAGYAPNAAQVGQTGKTVAPDVYMAFGISGAIQHLAGMKDAKVIVAVNKDPDAPIFSVADYGIVADLFEVMTALDERIAQHAQ